MIFSLLVRCALFAGLNGVFLVDADQEVSLMEGKSVVLNTDIIKNQQDRIQWYFNGKRIAEITGAVSKICTDDQCKERFRDRLKVDNETGSLTITKTRTEDSGKYELQINRRNIEKIFNVTVLGFPGANTDELSVFLMEGDSVTLHTELEITQEDRIIWYFNSTRITEILNYQSQICTNDLCKERFRDRLKMDNKTGSLTITDTRAGDSGKYELHINRRNIEKIFNVIVLANERDGMKRHLVKEGQSVTLDPGEIKNSIYLNTWCFNGIFIAEITGDQSQICEDVECIKRFRDRLKVDHQTGSLTITDIRAGDSGEYNLRISCSRFKIKRTFTVSVTALSAAGLSPYVIGGICGAVILAFGAAGLICFFFRKYKQSKGRESQQAQDDNYKNNINGDPSDPASVQLLQLNSPSHQDENEMPNPNNENCSDPAGDQLLQHNSINPSSSTEENEMPNTNNENCSEPAGDQLLQHNNINPSSSTEENEMPNTNNENCSDPAGDQLLQHNSINPSSSTEENEMPNTNNENCSDPAVDQLLQHNSINPSSSTEENEMPNTNNENTPDSTGVQELQHNNINPFSSTDENEMPNGNNENAPHSPISFINTIDDPFIPFMDANVSVDNMMIEDSEEKI